MILDCFMYVFTNLVKGDFLRERNERIANKPWFSEQNNLDFATIFLFYASVVFLCLFVTEATALECQDGLQNSKLFQTRELGQSPSPRFPFFKIKVK